MGTRSPYEDHAEAYDGWFDENRFAFESELRAVRFLLPRGGTGVEVGVGTGRFAGELGIAIGVEPSRSMRRIARERGISVIAGVAEALPFRDGRFDFVLLVTVLCFLDDAVASLREARRVLNPSGSLVIGFLDRDSPVGKTVEDRKDESPYYRHATFYSAREVASLLERAGFASMSFVQTIFRDPAGMDGPDPVREGHGQGCFVVVRADRDGRVSPASSGDRTPRSEPRRPG